jgi:hypothetical protein
MVAASYAFCEWPMDNKVERLVSDELPAVDTHRFAKTSTTADGQNKSA